MQIYPFLPIVLVGTLRRDFIITPGGKAVNDTLGGHLFYSATGLYHWEKQFGLVARIGSSFPNHWLEQMCSYGMDTRGIKCTDLPIDHRFFIRYDEHSQKSMLHPLAQYANGKLPFPKNLLGYNVQKHKFDSLANRSDETIVARDIPQDYLESSFIHLCPMDYLTHNLLTQHFTQSAPKRMSIRTGSGYMAPQFLNVLPQMMHGLSVLFTDEVSLKALFFDKRTGGLWDMMKRVCDWGVESVVIQQPDHSNLLFDARTAERYHLKPYPTVQVSLTGLNDAFCGGFVGNLQKTYSLRQALVAGTVAASFVMEGNQPFYSMDVVPGLHAARAEFLTGRIETLKEAG